MVKAMCGFDKILTITTIILCAVSMRQNHPDSNEIVQLAYNQLENRYRPNIHGSNISNGSRNTSGKNIFLISVDVKSNSSIVTFKLNLSLSPEERPVSLYIQYDVSNGSALEVYSDTNMDVDKFIKGWEEYFRKILITHRKSKLIEFDSRVDYKYCYDVFCRYQFSKHGDESISILSRPNFYENSKYQNIYLKENQSPHSIDQLSEVKNVLVNILILKGFHCKVNTQPVTTITCEKTFEYVDDRIIILRNIGFFESIFKISNDPGNAHNLKITIDYQINSNSLVNHVISSSYNNLFRFTNHGAVRINRSEIRSSRYSQSYSQNEYSRISSSFIEHNSRNHESFTKVEVRESRINVGEHNFNKKKGPAEISSPLVKAATIKDKNILEQKFKNQDILIEDLNRRIEKSESIIKEQQMRYNEILTEMELELKQYKLMEDELNRNKEITQRFLSDNDLLRNENMNYRKMESGINESNEGESSRLKEETNFFYNLIEQLESLLQENITKG